MGKSEDGGDVTTLAGRLRASREKLGLTQEQLAEEADTSQAVIQKIETGKSLYPQIIENLASTLGVRPAWL